MTIARIRYHVDRARKALAAFVTTLTAEIAAFEVILDDLDGETTGVSLVVALIVAAVTYRVPNEPAPNELDASRVEYVPLPSAQVGTGDPNRVETSGSDPVVTPIEVDDAYPYDPGDEQ